ncbi:MAG: hypothetical protein GW850_00910 [Sphingomonadales bacterium]|nr:hypothetical protein [Sphingomonadales bacterium]
MKRRRASPADEASQSFTTKRLPRGLNGDDEGLNGLRVVLSGVQPPLRSMKERGQLYGVLGKIFYAADCANARSLAQMIMLDECVIAVAGGVESMSQFPYVVKSRGWVRCTGDDVIKDAMNAILPDPFVVGNMGDPQRM